MAADATKRIRIPELVMSVPESEQIDRVDLDRVAAVTVRPLA